MIRKRVWTILAYILLVSITISINTGCNKQTQNSTNIFTTSIETEDSIDEKPPATWENLSWMKNTSPVRMSVFIDEPYALAAKNGWGNDVISKEVTRLTGVSLDVYSQAAGGVTAAIYEKDLDTLLASDNLTDFVFTDRNTERFEDIGICYPWDELIPQTCPELFDLVDPIELLNNVSDDGHIYTFKTEYKDEQVYRDENSLSAEYGAWNLTYRADVLAGAQLPLFVSVEALDETLYAVQRQGTQWGLQAIYYRDPESISALAKYMGCPTEHYWDADQKKITAFYTDSAWLEYYKLMNRWYRDGILPKDYPDLQASQIYDYNNSCNIFVKDCGVAQAMSSNTSLRKSLRGGDSSDLSKPVYAALEEYLTYRGDIHVVNTDYETGRKSFFITRNCRTPDRAILFAEFLKSPVGDRLTRWGIEGENYIFEDGVWSLTDSAREEREKAFVAYKTQLGGGFWTFQKSGQSVGFSKEDAEDEYGEKDLEKMIQFLRKQKVSMYANKNPVMSYARITTLNSEWDYLKRIEERWETLDAELISAPSEAQVELLWNDFQKFLEFNGIRAIEERMTQRFTNHLKRYQDAGYYTDIG